MSLLTWATANAPEGSPTPGVASGFHNGGVALGQPTTTSRSSLGGLRLPTGDARAKTRSSITVAGSGSPKTNVNIYDVFELLDADGEPDDELPPVGFGERKKSQDKVYPKGYVFHLRFAGS